MTRAEFNAKMRDLREEALRRGLPGSAARFRRATEESSVLVAIEQATHRPTGRTGDRNADLWEMAREASEAFARPGVVRP